MEKHKKLIIIIIVAIAILVSLNLALIKKYYSEYLPSLKRLATPVPISKPTPVKTFVARGTVVSVNNTILAVKSKNKTSSFNISETTDIQGVVSGSPEKSDVVSVKTTKDELRVGQEVIVIAELNTNVAKSIYIFKKL